MSIQLTEEELARRRPVWSVLSNLFLDTDHSLFYESTANALRMSGYTEEEAKRILTDEVAPVVSPNLLSLAGEWAMFPDDWLEAEIRQHLARAKVFRSMDILASKIVVTSVLRTDWPPIRKAVWGDA